MEQPNSEPLNIQPCKLSVEGLTFDFVLPEKVARVLRGMPAYEAALDILPMILEDERLKCVGDEKLTLMREHLKLMALSESRLTVS